MMRKEQALEAYLIAGAQSGEWAAKERSVRLRGPRLLAHATRLLGERELARDVVQTAWIDIFAGLAGLRDPAAFLPWALRIVSRKVAAEIARRQKTRAFLHEYAEAQDLSVEPLGEQHADAQAVRRAIDQLPAPMRAAIALFYLDDLSVAEVAMALDVPQGTVKTRLMHARERLRWALQGDSK